MEIPDVPVCASEHGAHRLQHAGAAGGGAATRDVPTRARGNTQVSCQQTLRSDHQLKGTVSATLRSAHQLKGTVSAKSQVSSSA